MSSATTTTNPNASFRSMSVESFKVMDVLRKANELQSLGHDVLHCEVGQPETGAPVTVAQAAVSALNEPRVMGYTDAFGLIELRSKINQHYMRYYPHKGSSNSGEDYGGGNHDHQDGPNPGIERIVVTTGSSGGFLLAFTSCFDVGDVVAIASSGYPCYRNILSALGCELAIIEINEEFKLTAKELQQEIERRSNNQRGLKPIKGLILSSPSNPTGAMLTPIELKELCELCDSTNIQFISDEIYHGISYGKEEATALQYSDKALVINSFSKYYSMSGWRLGWMVIPEYLIDPINTLQQNMFINAPTISQTAALQCWEDDTIEILEQHVEKYKQSRSIILTALETLESDIPKANIAPSDGGFYIYVDVGDANVALPDMGTVAMCETLLEEKYVAFTPGNDFEDPNSNLGNRRFRISYAGGVNTVKQAMDRFLEFWPTWIDRVHQAKQSSGE